MKTRCDFLSGRVEGQVWRDGCGSWACPSCSVVLGAHLQRRLRSRLDGLRVVMVTLTVNRTLFASPFAAWDYIKQQRQIPRAVAEFYAAHGLDQAGQWISKMELQAGGWPHWHLLLIVPESLELPKKGAFDDFWRWGFSNVRHKSALGYFTKYVSKGASVEDLDKLAASGLPAKGVRWVTAARGFWNCPRDEREYVAPIELRMEPDEAEGYTVEARVRVCDLRATVCVEDPLGRVPRTVTLGVSRGDLERMLEMVGGVYEVEPGRGGVWILTEAQIEVVAELVEGLWPEQPEESEAWI